MTGRAAWLPLLVGSGVAVAACDDEIRAICDLHLTLAREAMSLQAKNHGIRILKKAGKMLFSKVRYVKPPSGTIEIWA